MARLHELKLRFRLRIAVPILEAPWRRSLRGFDRPVPTLLNLGAARAPPVAPPRVGRACAGFRK